MVSAIVVRVNADTYEVQTPPGETLALGDTLVLQQSEDALDGARFRLFISALLLDMSGAVLTPKQKHIKDAFNHYGKQPMTLAEFRQALDGALAP